MNRRLDSAALHKPVIYRGVRVKNRLQNGGKKNRMLREGYDPPISRSPEAKTRECTSEPYESGALTS